MERLSAVLLFSSLSPHCRDEADEFVDIGALNGIFVLGRSMGFIGKLLFVAIVTSARRPTLLFISKSNCLFFFGSSQGTTWTRRDWSRVCTVTHGMTSPMCFQSTCLCNSLHHPGHSPALLVTLSITSTKSTIVVNRRC